MSRGLSARKLGDLRAEEESRNMANMNPRERRRLMKMKQADAQGAQMAYVLWFWSLAHTLLNTPMLRLAFKYHHLCLLCSTPVVRM